MFDKNEPGMTKYDNFERDFVLKPKNVKSKNVRSVTKSGTNPKYTLCF